MRLYLNKTSYDCTENLHLFFFFQKTEIDFSDCTEMQHSWRTNFLSHAHRNSSPKQSLRNRTLMHLRETTHFQQYNMTLGNDSHSHPCHNTFGKVFLFWGKNCGDSTNRRCSAGAWSYADIAFGFRTSKP